jgi:hypothetical protein
VGTQIHTAKVFKRNKSLEQEGKSILEKVIIGKGTKPEGLRWEATGKSLKF